MSWKSSQSFFELNQFGLSSVLLKYYSFFKSSSVCVHVLPNLELLNVFKLR